VILSATGRPSPFPAQPLPRFHTSSSSDGWGLRRSVSPSLMAYFPLLPMETTQIWAQWLVGDRTGVASTSRARARGSHRPKPVVERSLVRAEQCLACCAPRDRMDAAPMEEPHCPPPSTIVLRLAGAQQRAAR